MLRCLRAGNGIGNILHFMIILKNLYLHTYEFHFIQAEFKGAFKLAAKCRAEAALWSSCSAVVALLCKSPLNKNRQVRVGSRAVLGSVIARHNMQFTNLYLLLILHSKQHHLTHFQWNLYPNFPFYFLKSQDSSLNFFHIFKNNRLAGRGHT